MMGRRRVRDEDTEPPTGAASPPVTSTETRRTTVLETSEKAPEPAPEPEQRRGYAGERRRFSLRTFTPLLVLRSAHPRQALLTAIGLAVAAALANRPTREVGLVFVTVLVGQAVLGWHNDLVDRDRDATHAALGKPVADGRLDASTAWFVLACGVLLVVPLAISNGVTSGLAYLASLAIGLLGNLILRTGFLSWLPWAAAFALYPSFLSYGGWDGEGSGGPPVWQLVALSAALGIGVHFLTALWGLVADNEDGWTYLPLKLGLRLGAGRLLAVTCFYIVVVLVGMAFAGTYVGLAL
jgi:hypothetical protein